MSDEGHIRWRDDLAAYILGSLEADERALLERHLEGCEPCRAELRWLRPAIEVLSDSVERVEPRPELRQRLMSDVRADVGTAGQPVTSGRPLGERMRTFMLRPATALAATALIGAGAAGYALSDGGGEEATTIPGPPIGAVGATLERKGDSGTLQLTGLEQLPSGEVYQAWVRRGERIKPSSLFEARMDGTASAAIPHELNGADEVMVTVEPRGGSEEPTSGPLASVDLDS
jgi:anti-sigma-K factor RskA